MSIYKLAIKLVVSSCSMYFNVCVHCIPGSFFFPLKKIMYIMLQKTKIPRPFDKS